MLNYDTDPSVLYRYVPNGTELETWNGKTFVTIVGLLFLNTKILGFSIPFHRNFEEVNLRFYVRRKTSQGWRRGVVFIREIAPRRAVAIVARHLYNENYVTLRMRHQICLEGADDRRSVSYEWNYGGVWNSLCVAVTGQPVQPQVDSHEDLITEQSWGYARQRDGGTLEYRVNHPRWDVWRATQAHLSCTVGDLYGSELAESLTGEPFSALLATGSPVIVHKGIRVTP